MARKETVEIAYLGNLIRILWIIIIKYCKRPYNNIYKII
ncbi:hypothetical protein FDC06_00325 [Clostridium botulinum]|uniref:Uncharacterized protein n=1 Tax=Clostridium botulinum (strain Hall / ATCC 3502 / NCTC 13319 / Type A) TaxID=441771 RepID=A5I3K8_CLOBH|nr:hypothetical protein CLB_2024 [Clostridium botulinum A str. ATCC 19397]ABS38832.1 hypothetical protein CLC_2029 [Clostridium botulinum A str. Hall]AWB17951.1 hypothetical protein DB732_10845 [Clostridium botulinum]EPS49195.1 hypothetical protein CFSAN002369_13540 [Clostridium botulinum CFSAN002369]CAL83627.1 hypothetical protein CBO2087 [Clostridium botulinum A str. ATCC 3502]